MTRDDLVQCVAGIRAVRDGQLDRLRIPEKPLDMLAQQMVAVVASLEAGAKNKKQEDEELGSGMREEKLWELVRRAYPYRNLTKAEFEQLAGDVVRRGIDAAGPAGRLYSPRSD